MSMVSVVCLVLQAFDQPKRQKGRHQKPPNPLHSKTQISKSPTPPHPHRHSNSMVLYVVGLGLGDEDDITVRGLKAVQRSEIVFLEAYTSVLGTPKERLEAAFGKSIIVADRTMVESEAERIYLPAKETDVCFLVVGDPLCATTHSDIILRAKEAGIPVEVVHNASVMGAVASCGLQLYSFGYTVSIPLFEGEWRPDSFYPKIAYNRAGGMHTLCLLDIKMKEPDYEEMMRGRVRYLPPRFMTVNIAIEQLLAVEAVREEGVLSLETPAVGLARLGQPTQQIVAGTLGELLEVDFEGPLHCLVICGEQHPCEVELLQFFHVSRGE